jgi:hypothetical protein
MNHATIMQYFVCKSYADLQKEALRYKSNSM